MQTQKNMLTYFLLNNNLDEYSLRSKMLKMVGRVMQILEEKRDPQIVVERVVLGNPRYFDKFLKTNVTLPFNPNAELEILTPF